MTPEQGRDISTALMDDIIRVLPERIQNSQTSYRGCVLTDELEMTITCGFPKNGVTRFTTTVIWKDLKIVHVFVQGRSFVEYHTTMDGSEDTLTHLRVALALMEPEE